MELWLNKDYTPISTPSVMRKVGSEGAPTAKDFKESAKTAKPQSRKDMIREKMKDM